MESIREMYKIGNGPSSSHTMGPSKAALIFKEKNPGAATYCKGQMKYQYWPELIDHYGQLIVWKLRQSI